MSERQFLEPVAKERCTTVIRAVEAETSVEVVVAVRRAASRHVATSVAFGLVSAVVGFAVMWLSPQAYDVKTMPLDAGLALVLGMALVASVPRLRRWLTPRSRLAASAERAARVAFEELGIQKTRGRTGLLVYVALFERRAVLVPDTGVPAELASDALVSIGRELSLAVERQNFDAFLTTLARLGPACGAVLPRRSDDENELCDDVA